MYGAQSVDELVGHHRIFALNTFVEQIQPDGERAALARKNYHSYSGFVFGPPKRCEQVLQHRCVECIERGRPVQFDDGDGIAFDMDGYVVQMWGCHFELGRGWEERSAN